MIFFVKLIFFYRITTAISTTSVIITTKVEIDYHRGGNNYHHGGNNYHHGGNNYHRGGNRFPPLAESRELMRWAVVRWAVVRWAVVRRPSSGGTGQFSYGCSGGSGGGGCRGCAPPSRFSMIVIMLPPARSFVTYRQWWARFR